MPSNGSEAVTRVAGGSTGLATPACRLSSRTSSPAARPNPADSKRSVWTFGALEVGPDFFWLVGAPVSVTSGATSTVGRRLKLATFHWFLSGWMVVSAAVSKTCGGSPLNAPERKPVAGGNVTAAAPSASAATSAFAETPTLGV